MIFMCVIIERPKMLDTLDWKLGVVCLKEDRL